MNVEQIARICHEANKAYCESIGDDSQVSWDDAEDWQRESAIQGVKSALATLDITPEIMHVNWCQSKSVYGWVYGPEKDAEKKTHPCLVTYSALSPEQKVKDHLFLGVVRAFVSAEE